MKRKLLLLTMSFMISTTFAFPVMASEEITEVADESSDLESLQEAYETLQADYDELKSKYEEVIEKLAEYESSEAADMPTYDITGTVNEVNDETFTVTTSKGNVYTFSVDGLEVNIGESVAFTYSGEISSKNDIQPGIISDFEVTAAAPAGAEYETGITYDDLSRNPDAHIGDLIKFSGTVVQLIEDTSSDEIQIRLAVNDDYDTILYCGYDKTIVSSRVLEDDWITIYGTSLGLISYESTLGGTITIPAAWVDQIDQ